MVEKIETLDKTQEAHQLKLDHQIQTHNNERRELTEKQESQASKIA